MLGHQGLPPGQGHWDDTTCCALSPWGEVGELPGSCTSWQGWGSDRSAFQLGTQCGGGDKQ